MRLSHDHLGVEHVLLALLRDASSGAVRALGGVGVTAAAAEEQLIRYLTASARGTEPALAAD